MKPRLLIDLKPALDGYAGIPQETRLLFNALSQNEEFITTGLIQHGGKQLKANKKTKTSNSEYRDAKAILSFTDYKDSWFKNFLAILGRKVTTYNLNIDNYQDFLWSSLFSKTLDVKQKNHLLENSYQIIESTKHSAYRAGLIRNNFLLNAKFPKLMVANTDILVAQTPYPMRISPKTKLIIRYHDAVPLLMPYTIKDRSFHLNSHYMALKSNVQNGAWFACVSEATRCDLLKFFPEVEQRSSVIYNMLPDTFYEESSESIHVNEIVRTRLIRQEKQTYPDENEIPFYLLMVSSIEPRKNHKILLEAWEQLRIMGHSTLKLIIVGNPGWDCDQILDSFQSNQEVGQLFHLQNVPAHELRILYRHAAATICPSLMEGFDYSGIEAMKSGGYVAASDISVHREVYENAALYFDPYSAESAAQAIDQLLNGTASKIKEQLRHAKEQLLPRYETKKLVNEWSRFIQKILNSSRA